MRWWLTKPQACSGFDEANSGQLLRITLDGTVTRAVDFL